MKWDLSVFFSPKYSLAVEVKGMKLKFLYKIKLNKKHMYLLFIELKIGGQFLNTWANK